MLQTVALPTLSMAIEPFSCAAISVQIDSPRPNALRFCRVLKIGSNKRLMVAGGISGPESETETVTMAGSILIPILTAA